MARPAVLAVRIVGQSRSAQASIKAVQKDLARLKASVIATAKAMAAASAAKALTAALAPIATAAASAGIALGVFGLAAGKQVAAMAEVSGAAKKYADAQQDAATKKVVADRLSKQGSELAEKAQKQYDTALLKVATTQQAWKDSAAGIPDVTANAALALAQLKAAYGAWSDSLSGTTMPLFTQGLNIARKALVGLTPLVTAAARAIKPFLDRIQAAVDSGAFGAWAKQMARIGGPVLKNLLDGIANLGAAFGTLLTKMGPSSRQAGKLIADLTKRFAQWSKGSGGTQFAKLARQAVPALGQLAAAAVRVSTAFTPWAGVTIKLAVALASLINALPLGVIQALVPIVLALVVAYRALRTVMIAVRLYMLATAASVAINTAAANGNRAAVVAQTVAARAAVVVQRAWALVTQVSTVAMLAQRTVMLAVRTATLAWAAAQRVLNLVLIASPIGIVIAAIVALIAIVVVAYKKSSTFRAVVQVLWGVLKALGRFIAGYYVGAWHLLRSSVSFVISVVKSVIIWFRRIVVPSELARIKAVFNTVRAAVVWLIDKVRELIRWFRRIVLPGALAQFKSGLDSARRAASWLVDKVKQVINWMRRIPGGGLLSKAISKFSAPNPLAAAQPRVRSLRAARLGAAPVSRVGLVAPQTHVYVSIDGQQLQGRITKTVSGAMRADGARLMAGGWA